MFKYIIVFVICCGIPFVFAERIPPKAFKKPLYKYVNRLMFYRVLNMTAELLHDTTQKLKQAEKIKDMHKHSIAYELGTISAEIQERFLRMLKIYRKYANMKDFAAGTYETNELLEAYHVIQGDYNEIRMEKDLFYEIKKRHASLPESTVDFKDALIKAHMTKEPGKKTRGRRIWSRNDEESFNAF